MDEAIDIESDALEVEPFAASGPTDDARLGLLENQTTLDALEAIEALIPPVTANTGRLGGRPREWVSKEEVCEAWDLIISGESEMVVALRWRRERNIKESALLVAIADMQDALEIRDSDFERIKLVESARRMIGSLGVKLQDSQKQIVRIDRALTYLETCGQRCNLPLDSEPDELKNHPGALTGDSKNFWLDLQRLRQAELAVILKTSAEIRNYNMQLAELTGAKKAARRIKPGDNAKQVGPTDFSSLSKEDLEAMANSEQV